MYLIVGLGNPDNKYLKTMHNLGFMAIDMLAEKLGVEINKKAFKGVYGQTIIKGEKVLLLKPLTYMNLSGDCISQVLSYFKIPTQNMIVIYDDLDVKIGALRIREKGSAGTHNGMRDIVLKISSQDFPRIRVGSKPVNFKGDVIDYVLSDVKKEDEEIFKLVLKNAGEAAVAFASGESIEKVMNKYNKDYANTTS